MDPQALADRRQERCRNWGHSTARFRASRPRPPAASGSARKARGRLLTAEDTEAASLHGRVRRKQGYTAPLVVREAKLLLQSLAECVQQNLLAIQVSYLI